MQLDANVSQSPVEEPGRPQHQHQQQVSWEGPLKDNTPTLRPRV